VSVSVDEIKRAAEFRWDELLCNFGLTREQVDSLVEIACPKCHGNTRFRPFRDGTGGARCSHCFADGCGDGIAVIMWLNNWSFAETIQKLADYLGLNGTTRTAPTAQSVDPILAPVDQPMGEDATAGHVAAVRQNYRSKFTEEAQASIIEQALATFCSAKRPLTPATIEVFGGVTGILDSGKPYALPCVVWPGYLKPGDAEPWGYIVRRADGKEFEGYKNREPSKTRLILKSKDSWNWADPQAVLAANTVWMCEGFPDAATLHPHLPDGHVAITSLCGAQSTPKEIGFLAGKNVVIVFDADQAGVDGAIKRAAKIRKVAKSVKIVCLPYDVLAAHGKDLRDWFNEGGTFAALLAMAEAAPEFAGGKVSSSPVVGGDSEPIANYDTVFYFDVEGKEKESKEPRPLSIITESIFSQTGKYPRRVGSQLFGPSNNRDGVSWLRDSDGLFSYLGAATNVPPTIHSNSGFHTKREIHSHLSREAIEYLAVESLPHHPPIDGHYYACEIPKPGDGTLLDRLVDYFSPETDIDRDLIKAMFVTPFWGGARWHSASILYHV
jgi:hypothetical protein